MGAVIEESSDAVRLFHWKDVVVAFDQDRVRALHGRLLAGDRVAPAELSKLVVPELVRRLSGRWPSLRGTDAVYDAAVEVFVAYLKAPERYDPSRGTLVGWLQTHAQGDLTNDYRSAPRSFDRRQVATVGVDPVAELSGSRKEAHVTIDAYPSDEEGSAMRRAVDALDDPRDRALLGLIIDREGSTATAAAVLAIEHLPHAEQARLVKQNKDRVRARVRRLLKDGS